MGHTLITTLSNKSMMNIQHAMESVGASHSCKIPYGRNCDREEADHLLPYHITLAHWGKNEDSFYISRLQKYCFSPCNAIATDLSFMSAEENSLLLYLEIKRTASFSSMEDRLLSLLSIKNSSFLHMTLAVSTDHNDIIRIEKDLRDFLSFPYEIEIVGLDLYHIWNPVYRVASFM